MTATTFKHRTPDGMVHTRRSEHPYAYVVVRAERWVDPENGRSEWTYHIRRWSKTADAAYRAAGKRASVQRINGGEA